MSEAYAAAQRHQRQAADPAHSVFVTANAGSGKTKVLVDRIARLLLAGAAPSAFLCITFTKAAAAEMQRRLFERLGAWCVADDDKLTKELLDLGEAAPDHERLAKARALFARALETPGGLRIQTIHGFCERLIARFPLEAGVAPGFEIAEETRGGGLIETAWARVVGDADGDIDGALDRFGARLDARAFEALVATLAARRADIDGYVRTAGALDHARAAILDRHDAHDPPAVVEAAAIAAVEWDTLIAMQAILEESGGDDAKTASRIAIAREKRTLDAVLDIFLKSDGEPYAKLCKKAVQDKHGALVSACEAVRAGAIAARAKINAAERAADAVAALTIGHALSRAYEKAKDEAGALDFEDLIERASALLSGAAAAPWVLYKLDGGLTHILIDEGQDTSPAQWALIAPLQAEFFAGEGAGPQDRTVFAVGDPKQSIYSFQGADPAHFLRESHALSKRADAARRGFVAPSLLMSFRSAPEVLTAVDCTFEGLALADDATAGDVIVHAAHRAGQIGRVEWWPLAPKPVQTPSQPWDAPLDTDSQSTSVAVLCNALAARVKGWIDAGEAVWEKGVQRAMRPGDVLALVRSRGPLFTQLLRAMKRAGLPVAGADRMTLADEISVQDILAAARVALDPTDDLSLATLLKSPWIGLVDDDTDIFPLAHGRADGEHVIDRLRNAEDVRFASARVYVEDLISNASAHPHAFVSSILERVDGEAVSGWERMLARLGAEARDPVEELLSRALAAGRRGPATLQHFVFAIESDSVEVKRQTEHGEDAVRVMTVHGAKGLESPVVLLADTSGAVKSDPAGNLYITPGGPVMRGGRDGDDAVVTVARAAADAAAELEHRRLLYVAMTRARDRLIVCGHQRGNAKSGASENSWWDRVRDGMTRAGAQPCETPFGEGLALGEVFVARKAVQASIDATTVPAWARRAANVEGPAAEAIAPSRLAQGPVLSPRADGRSRFRRGALIHGLLQRLPDVPPQRREGAATAWLGARGVRGDEASAYIGEALRVLDDPAFAAVFGPDSRAEAPIVATLADGVVVRGSIDRMVVGKTQVLLLDYKTDRPPPDRAEDTPPRILAQMAAYRAALAMVFPGRIIEAALLWTDGPRLMALPPALLDVIRPADARC